MLQRWRYFSSEYEPKIKQDMTFKVVKENVDPAQPMVKDQANTKPELFRMSILLSVGTRVVLAGAVQRPSLPLSTSHSYPTWASGEI